MITPHHHAGSESDTLITRCYLINKIYLVAHLSFFISNKFEAEIITCVPSLCARPCHTVCTRFYEGQHDSDEQVGADLSKYMIDGCLEVNLYSRLEM